MRRTRKEMEETRATLIASARKMFSETGYADAVMDELTGQAGLTRGALYHHFGDKKGLLAAVVEQIDAEMDARLTAISSAEQDAWLGFTRRCEAYLTMALEPEYQRIVLRDARAVLGGASPASQHHCIEAMQQLLAQLIAGGIVAEANPQALASLLYGSLAEAAFWIAEAEEGEARLAQSKAALTLLLRGLRSQPGDNPP